jgi:hypothetical protein
MREITVSIKPNLACHSAKHFIFVLILISILSGCVYAIKPAKPIPPDPRARDSIATEIEIRAVHFVPRPEIHLGFTSRRYEVLPVEDPLVTVEESFVDALKSHYPAVNIKRIPQSRLNNSLVQFKRTYIRGLIFSFHTTNWELDPYWEGKKLYHRINYSVIGRLIRVESQEILWLKECQIIESDPLGKKTAYIDYQKDKYTLLLKARRKEIVEKCSVELINNFMGI